MVFEPVSVLRQRLRTNEISELLPEWLLLIQPYFGHSCCTDRRIFSASSALPNVLSNTAAGSVSEICFK